MSGLRICLIASSRFPVAEPFVGGLEAHTHALTRALIERGHSVTLFAGEGSDPALGAETLIAEPFEPSPGARRDVGAPPLQWMQEHHAYLALCLELAASGADRFDVIHNNSLHHLPVAMSSAIEVPMLTTLHTPPTPWLESALPYASERSRFVAVSGFTARQWRDSVRASVVLNGVDIALWQPGPGGGPAIWFGRLVPEKAPHLAIRAAQLAGMPLDLAGPVLDDAYFEAEVAPHLGSRDGSPRIRYLGHLGSVELAERVGEASVTVVTPSWDEPYGLVAAESMAAGTPVAALARGGLIEVISPESGRLCQTEDAAELARAMREASGLSRAETRAHAVAHCSIEAMVDAYERCYASLADERRAA
ncbi:glycosyltransferase family 4 protein [Agrococcus sp. Marseille-Q4369]|uniref:glycosyltransferase family 4 protein n=1 Tax=Agrococcus sp. Marseille-Q4369 TaxID=2810513 RepID=UPI0020169645|nr:glycosyltransferase family 4 protein [Agrococcus sp. Marseille-Q4369]